MRKFLMIVNKSLNMTSEDFIKKKFKRDFFRLNVSQIVGTKCNEILEGMGQWAVYCTSSQRFKTFSNSLAKHLWRLLINFD